MIKVNLNVDEICHKCPKFSPEYNHVKVNCLDGCIIDDNIFITCEHKELCSYLKKYFALKSILRKENDL